MKCARSTKSSASSTWWRWWTMSLLAALPALTTKATELAAALKVRIGIVRAGDDVNAVLASIPAGADAVYVTPLRFSDAQLRELAQGLSAAQTTHVLRGRAQRGRSRRAHDHRRRRTRHRAARATRGHHDPAHCRRGRSGAPSKWGSRLRSACSSTCRWRATSASRRAGSSWRTRSSCSRKPGGAQPLTLLGAMRAALDANPALAASRERLGSALDDVSIARSGLLPSLSASAARTRIDEDRASPLTQAEDTTSAGH